MKTKKHGAIVLSSGMEKDLFAELLKRLKCSPVPGEETLDNLGLFLTSKTLSRIFFFYEIYKRIVNTHGVIMEFGVRWGQTLALFAGMRSIFEPFNRHRKIIGFDTFSGFRGVSSRDGKKSSCGNGAFSVGTGYREYLDGLLSVHEGINPMSHIKRFELVKGDAAKTVPAYFKKHPETIISLAFFDFDIYKPTKAALKAVKGRLAKGSILVFDELNDEYFPGETAALDDVFGLNKVKIERFPMTSRLSYIEFK